ncbi:MAG: rRNA maturation RNase YbeY [Elusimicrobia bacterium]|nr:rRNA maturation RNase YbeY [Elusimicrobiota bacterium]
MLRIKIIGRSLLPPSCRNRIPLFKKTVLRTLELEGKTLHGEICLTFVSGREIKRLHKKFFDSGTLTDVITLPYLGAAPFPSLKGAPVEATALADIFICAGQARRQAAEAGHPFCCELALLISHGVLHMLGHRDDDQASRKKMFQIQNRAIRLLARTDPQLRKAVPLPA